MVSRFSLAFAAFAFLVAPGCDKKANSDPETAAKPAPAQAAAPAPAPAVEAGAEPARAARTPKARRMPLAEPMTRCDAAGVWKLEARWRGGEGGACKGAPLDRNSFEFEVAEQDGEFQAALDWSNYTTSALEVTVDGAECLVDLQLDSLRVSGAGLIFNLTEKDGEVSGEGMYEAPIDLDSGKTCLREFQVTGKLVRPKR